jgi:AAA15 family ATPase/GTPase
MIIDMYENILLENREEEIDKLLSQYDNNIKKFKILPKKDEAIVVLENGKNLSINEVGDGFKRYLLLLLLLYNSKDGMLLVDEIENGIWYKNLPLVLSVISNLSKSLNIQLFMTTHSKDVIENLDIFDSFYLIEFKSRDKIITYDKNSFLIEVKNGFEVRG